MQVYKHFTKCTILKMMAANVRARDDDSSLVSSGMDEDGDPKMRDTENQSTVTPDGKKKQIDDVAVTMDVDQSSGDTNGPQVRRWMWNRLENKKRTRPTMI